jgi:hypothetical protein
MTSGLTTAMEKKRLTLGMDLLMGFDRNANPIEVLYNVIDEDTIKVFHAMKCRNVYVPLIKRKE